MTLISLRKNILLTFWSLCQVIFTAIMITFSKHLFLKGVDPINFSFQVLLTSGIIIFIYIMIRKRKTFEIPCYSTLGGIFLMAFFHGVLAFALSFMGLKYSSATNFSFLIQTGLVFSSILAFIFLGEAMNLSKILLISFMMIGVYLLSTAGALIVPSKGDLLIISGTLCFSIGVILAKILLSTVNPLTLTMIRNLFSSLSLFFILIALGQLQSNIEYTSIIFCGFMVSAAAYSMNKILRHSTVSYMNLMLMLTPVVTGVLAVIFLREVLSPIQIVGAVIILSSGTLVSKIELQKKAQPLRQ